jgi:hypothetical protein
MIQQMPQSEGNTLGFKAIGTIEQEDYKVLNEAVQAAIDESGDVNLLMDLTEFKWEKFTAWDDDMHFGHEYRKKIVRMAIVGDHGWEKLIAKMAEPFYAQDAKYFPSDDADAAWAWIKE